MFQRNIYIGTNFAFELIRAARPLQGTSRKRFAYLATIAAALAGSTAASAVTINFETIDTGGATTINSAIAATDYDAFGATFTGAFYKQCGGGCPAPSGGTFVSSLNFSSPFSVSFAGALSTFSFENVSFSAGTATAFDAANNALASFSFSAFHGLFGFNAAGIRSVTFSTAQGFGVDNFTFAATGGVPEPTSWALMIGGFGLTGAALRRRRSVLALV